MSRYSRSSRFRFKTMLAALGCFWWGTRSAEAHVKWFCAFDVAGQPRGLENVLCLDFELLVGLSALVLGFACILEGTILGHALNSSLDRVTQIVHRNADVLIRAACGFFLVSLWCIGGILLTPELKTSSDAVPWMQLGMAACLLSRKTMPLTAIGIVSLFIQALGQYGAFHLMDYPIFLGLALYLALVATDRTFFGLRPIDVVRWSAAITLMWASVEKWAYPEWTFPLFITHAKMTLGYDREFFMRAAGAIEFALAFSLILTPLVRRSSAIILAAMFVSAVAEFGKVDAIGHAPIIAALVAIAADRRAVVTGEERARAGLRQLLPAFSVPLGYVTALAISLALYYGLHALLFGTTLL